MGIRAVRHARASQARRPEDYGHKIRPRNRPRICKAQGGHQSGRMYSVICQSSIAHAAGMEAQKL